MAMKRQPKPLTFFGKRAKLNDRTGYLVAGKPDAVELFLDSITGAGDECLASVDIMGTECVYEIRKSPAAAIAAAERKTLKLLNRLASSIGHRLVKKGGK